jgi:hypothetical protein
MTRTHPHLFAVFLVLAAAFSSACSNAPRPGDIGSDDAGTTGAIGQPCNVNNTCDEGATCVSDGETLTCRQLCAREEEDPCGVGATCANAGEKGVCIPANAAGEPCPCDEGFACTALNSDGGPVDVQCRPSCNPSDEVSTCAEGERCRSIESSATEGACL